MKIQDFQESVNEYLYHGSKSYGDKPQEIQSLFVTTMIFICIEMVLTSILFALSRKFGMGNQSQVLLMHLFPSFGLMSDFNFRASESEQGVDAEDSDEDEEQIGPEANLDPQTRLDQLEARLYQQEDVNQVHYPFRADTQEQFVQNADLVIIDTLPTDRAIAAGNFNYEGSQTEQYDQASHQIDDSTRDITDMGRYQLTTEEFLGVYKRNGYQTPAQFDQ